RRVSLRLAVLPRPLSLPDHVQVWLAADHPAGGVAARAARAAAGSANAVAEGLAWILFFYIGTWHRIGHVATLFLDVVFVGFFVVLFWCAFALIARIA